MKLILGTVQLGMKYGRYMDNEIDNNESIKIIKYCIDNNIKTFDTAQNYGNSEKLLSNFKDNDLEIITKINFNSLNTEKEWEKSIDKSINNLKVSKLNTLLLHDIKDISNNELIEYLTNNKKIEKLGISIYDVDEINKLFNSKFIEYFKVIEMPVNLVDQINSDDLVTINNAKLNGKIIYARSIFLQGILLNDYDSWPIKDKLSLQIFNQIESICKSNNISKCQLCFSYVKSLKWIDGIIIGINSFNQLKNNLSEFNEKKSIIDIMNKVNIIETHKILRNPRIWK